MQHPLKIKITEASEIRQLARSVLWHFAKEFNCVQGAFYAVNNNCLKLMEGYAFHLAPASDIEIEIGDGIIGQVAKDGNYIHIEDIPEGYITVLSGLGSSSPNHLIVYPFKTKSNEVKAVMELAGFEKISQEQLSTLQEMSDDVVTELNRVM